MIKCKAGKKSLSIEPDGSILPCCVATSYVGGGQNKPHPFQSDFFKLDHWQSIQKFGATEKTCSYCLEQEKTKSYSIRNLMNDLLSDSEENSLEFLNIYLSNICNLRCRTCDSTRSFLIGKEKNEQVQKNVNEINFLKKLIDDHAKTLRYISFQGGEPFLYPDFQGLLQHINDRHPQIYVSVVSNGNHLPVWFFEKHHLLSRIKISIDGTKEAGEFVRKGLDWNSFITNFSKMCSEPRIKNKIVISITLSAFSVFQINTIIELAEKYQISKIDLNTVIHPKYLDIKNLNQKIKKILLAKTFKKFDTEIKKRLEMKSDIEFDPLNPQTMGLNNEEIQNAQSLFSELDFY